eukprot:SM000135S26994  [mRNA]  locus=s135:147380:150215:+ [translate_table: standard]
MKVENRGGGSVAELLLAMPAAQAQHVALVRAAVMGKGKAKGAAKTSLAAAPAAVEGGTANVSFWALALPEPLAPGEKLSVEALVAITGALEPFPAEIGQSDNQFVLFRDGHYALSPYPSERQSTLLRLPSARVESFTPLPPNNNAGKELTFGPYDNVPPLAHSPLTVHYEHDRPFAVAEDVVREIEVSHWGNVYVQEDYSFVHAGARHKGVFSRFEYQSRPHMSGVSSLRGLRARLPPSAHSIYYRDEIGNISTSLVRYHVENTELELSPRYPLLGGWRAKFTIGYSVPLEEFVSRALGGQRVLRATFSTPFEDVVVNNLVVKVVLPEGCWDINAEAPYEAEQKMEVPPSSLRLLQCWRQLRVMSPSLWGLASSKCCISCDEHRLVLLTLPYTTARMQTKYTYLDTVGRPVVVLQKRNLVPEHSEDFQVFYRFNPLAQLVEPLLLVAAFFTFFLASMAYVRCDFTIAKSSTSYQAKLQREAMMDAMQRLQKVMAVRLSITERLEASLRDLVRTGDVAAAKASRKLLEASLKDTAKDVKSVTDVLEASPRAAHVLPRVQTLVAKEREKQDKVLQKHIATSDAFERKLPRKEIDQRVAPLQEKVLSLTLEVRELLQNIEA